MGSKNTLKNELGFINNVQGLEQERIITRGNLYDGGTTVTDKHAEDLNFQYINSNTKIIMKLK